MLARFREDFWRYLSPASSRVELLAQAAALTKMPPEAIRELAEIEFLTSAEVERLLDELPKSMRQLATTAVAVEDHDPERVAGSPRWGRTMALRATTGLDHVVVTAPAQRSHDTAENRLLAFLLGEIATIGSRMRWYRARGGDQAKLVRRRTDTARRWGQARALSGVTASVPTAREVRRVRSGRRARRYASALHAYEIHRDLIAKGDVGKLREAVEREALAVSDTATVLEILVTFAIIAELEKSWEIEPLHIVHAGDLRMKARRGNQRLELVYQSVPQELKAESPYLEILDSHGIRPVTRRPDLVLRISDGDEQRWCLVEIKGGEAGVEKLARRATFDLHAYRRTFTAALEEQPLERPYGLGIVWGEGLQPQAGEIALCSVDQIAAALALLLD